MLISRIIIPDMGLGWCLGRGHEAEINKANLLGNMTF